MTKKCQEHAGPCGIWNTRQKLHAGKPKVGSDVVITHKLSYSNHSLLSLPTPSLPTTQPVRVTESSHVEIRGWGRGLGGPPDFSTLGTPPPPHRPQLKIASHITQSVSIWLGFWTGDRK